MSNEPQELEVVQSTALEIPARNLSVSRAPDEVLREAQKAAAVLKDVISKKKNPVKFNGRQYLEFEDWQTVGRFYGLTARVRESKYVQYGEAKGFEAIADAVLVATGDVVSTAEAMCLDDERNWKTRTLNQIRSMAQTRACAKALRNVLSWVVVLAGYAPTPMEEMDGIDTGGHPAGTQAAANAVRDRKLKEAEQPAVEIPGPLRTLFEGIDAGTKGFVTQGLELAKERLIECLQNGGETGYRSILEDHGITEGIKPTKGQVKAAILDMWQVCEAAIEAAPEVEPEKTPVQSAFDEHMKEPVK